MSDQEKTEVTASFECGMCGVVDRTGCDLCSGNNIRFRRTRAFTLTEERRGENPDAAQKRYGLYGDVGPEQLRDSSIVLPRNR